jgi:hypothetical protein
MKTKGKYSWNSPLMEIVTAGERISKTTEKPYMVVKARMVFSGNIRFIADKKQAKKVYTMLCFSEPLFGLFEAGNVHIFEGELSFDWGNTWLKITKLYDNEGNRLLRPTETEKTNAFDEKLADSIGKDVNAYFTKRIKEIRDGDEPPFCTFSCEACLDYNTSGCPLY